MLPLGGLGVQLFLRRTKKTFLPVEIYAGKVHDAGMNDMNRIGIGYDIHNLVEGRPLVIGGVEIAHEKGLAGHSDADVLIHAVIDALLGAAAAGDIGEHFSDTDLKWKDVDSRKLLEMTLKLIDEEGYRIVNCDCIVVLETPRLTPYKKEIRNSLAKIAGLDGSQISIKAKTNEKNDAIGRGEAIAAHAAVLIARKAE